MPTNASAPLRVSVRPEMLRWARERAGKQPADFVNRFPGAPAWERGEKQPTLKQLEAFAKATNAPVGFFFLKEPPEEQIPIPDFRTIADRPVGRPRSSGHALPVPATPGLVSGLCSGGRGRLPWICRFRAPEGQHRVGGGPNTSEDRFRSGGTRPLVHLGRCIAPFHSTSRSRRRPCDGQQCRREQQQAQSRSRRISRLCAGGRSGAADFHKRS